MKKERTVQTEEEMVLSREEGYELTENYVKYFWYANKFYSLKNTYELEDIVHEIYCKFLDKKFFEKYNYKITSKKYHVMNGVRTSMIDMLRKYRDVYSLDAPNEMDLTLGDLMTDNTNIAQDVVHSTERDRIIESLPDISNSKLIGYSDLLGECVLSYRAIVLHLEAGYAVKEIADMFINPASGRPITTGRIPPINQRDERIRIRYNCNRLRVNN